MVRNHFLDMRTYSALLVALTAFACATAPPGDDAALSHWLKAPNRTERNMARDGFRHPIGTLLFFGVREDSTVVEILPGKIGRASCRERV